jgi:hypothetical protein
MGVLKLGTIVLILGTTGCAAVPSCTIGISLFGPIPVPHATCDVTLYEDDEEDED